MALCSHLSRWLSARPLPWVRFRGAMVRPLLADPPGWHHISHWCLAPCSPCLHSAQCSLQSAVRCTLPIPPLDCTEHSISTGQNMNPASFPSSRCGPLWHLCGVVCFWATVLDLFYRAAARLIVLPRTLFPVLTGSCMARCPLQCLHYSTSTSTLPTCFFVCFVLSALPRAPPASPPAIHAVQ